MKWDMSSFLTILITVAVSHASVKATAQNEYSSSNGRTTSNRPPFSSGSLDTLDRILHMPLSKEQEAWVSYCIHHEISPYSGVFFNQAGDFVIATNHDLLASISGSAYHFVLSDDLNGGWDYRGNSTLPSVDFSMPRRYDPVNNPHFALTVDPSTGRASLRIGPGGKSTLRQPTTSSGSLGVRVGGASSATINSQEASSSIDLSAEFESFGPHWKDCDEYQSCLYHINMDGDYRTSDAELRISSVPIVRPSFHSYLGNPKHDFDDFEKREYTGTLLYGGKTYAAVGQSKGGLINFEIKLGGNLVGYVTCIWCPTKTWLSKNASSFTSIPTDRVSLTLFSLQTLGVKRHNFTAGKITGKTIGSSYMQKSD